MNSDKQISKQDNFFIITHLPLNFIESIIKFKNFLLGQPTDPSQFSVIFTC